MATQVQFRGGSSTEHSSFTGAAREVTVDTTKDTLIVHDGSTAGGHPLAKENNPTFTGDLTIPDKIIHSGDTNTFIRFPAADTVSVDTAGSERLRIDSSGRLLVGASSAHAIVGFTPHLQTEGTTADASAIGIIRNSNGTGHPRLLFGKSRGTALGSNTVVQSGDPLGEIAFAGADGTDLTTRGASIEAQVDGTPGANDMPGRLLFLTTADGASSPTERLRIDNSGNVFIGGTTAASADIALNANGTSTFLGNMEINRPTSDNDNQLLKISNSTTGNNKLVVLGRGLFLGTDVRPGEVDTDANISLNADGSATFAGNISVGNNGTASDQGVVLNKNGLISSYRQANSPDPVWVSGREGPETAATCIISADGSATFAGNVTVGDKIIHNGDTNTAVRFPANDTVSVETAGSERLRIDSSGRLLVGTSSTSSEAKLLVQGGATAAGAALHLQRNTTTASAGSTIGYLRFANSADNAGATIFAEGEGTWTAGTSHPTRLTFSTTADGASSPTERMRITNGGGILLGCTAAPNPGAGSTASGFAINGTGNLGYITAKIDNNPVGYFRRDGTDGTVFDFRRGSSSVGTISVTASATAYNTSSDYRLKENVVPLTGASKRVNQLQVHRFNFIADPDKIVDGFIAHEAQAVVPEAVTGEKDGEDMQAIDQSKLVPLLTAALQEAIAKIETLEQRLSDAGIA